MRLLYLVTLLNPLGESLRIYIRADSADIATDYLASAFPQHSIVSLEVVP